MERGVNNLETFLEHYGTPRHSGRYPWGSGENPYQSEQSMMRHIERLRKDGKTDEEIASMFLKDNDGFLSYVNALHANGVSDVDIAKTFGRTTTWLRQKKSIVTNQAKAERTAIALRLREHGYSYEEIAKRIGVPNESTVRSLLARSEKRKQNAVENTANALKTVMETQPYLDISRGNAAILGISDTRLGTAVQLLKDEGYKTYNIDVEQTGTGYKTTIKVLCPPDATIKDAYNMAKENKIALANGFKVEDNGERIKFMKDPVSVDPNRVGIRYAEEGGELKDGVMEIRRGAKDLSLGASNYAQVRVLVGEDHYLKGMAVYSDDLPPGVDIVFNTNKHQGTDKMKVLKEVKKDKDGNIIQENMFGAVIRDQPTYIGDDGKEHQSAMNLVNPEGSWADWRKTISSQMLSKQSVELTKEQLKKTLASKTQEYDEIMALTNPTLKKMMLDEFATECDSAAVHLKAQGFDRQGSHVILPVNSLKDNEIYAPRYKDGEDVVLIRFPHAGQFEIPELKVNNKNKEAIDMMGKNAKDAVGINHKNAEILSGADFDGDTVLVIPNNDKKISAIKPLKDLAGFDPKSYYPAYEGMTKVGPKRKDGEDGFNKGREMGDVSNLITDMTIKGAGYDEIARAVRYSMVVIDAEKHQLNWHQAYKDNNIADLKKKYQGGVRAGASTIVSRAKSQEHIPQVSLMTRTDPETGELIRKETGKTYRKPDAEGNWTIEKLKMTKSNKITEAFARGGSAYDLVSEENTPIERAYADYANQMKALANRARKDAYYQPPVKVNKSAKETYKAEVESINKKVTESKKNAAYERQAQILANNIVSVQLKDNPGMTYEEKQRVKSQALDAARHVVKGDGKTSKIDITPREWEAIQAGAISNTTLITVLKKADSDKIKSYATPRTVDAKLSNAQIAALKNKMNSGRFSTADLAEQYGISVSTLYKIIE